MSANNSQPEAQSTTSAPAAESATYGSATYSPEDNKLRLYPDARLSPELYARVKAAGFIWAPVQKLFVAPGWSPEREDLLTELCGTVGDEETSLEERAEERAERFTGYKESRAADASAASDAVHAIADNIPLGQPILVGHHSERAARRDQEKIENGMRRAVKMWETSKYWEDRARGAVRNALYKERPEVRARRIKGLEADLRRREKSKSLAAFNLKIWSNPALTLEQGKHYANYYSPGYVKTATTEQDSAWSALEHGELTLEEVRAQLVPHLQEVIAWVDRWVGHLNNRLAYERLLYGESGGIAADRVAPEVGGACKCWVSHRGGWSYIKKVNRVSVTVEDNWGNGGENFTRTVPFTDLGGVMSRADVEAKRAAGLLVESPDGLGFIILAEALAKVPATAPPQEGEDFAKMKEQLREGVHVVVAPDLFPTPPDLAARMVEEAGIREGHRVLEPSAGTGNLLREIAKTSTRDVVAVEVNGQLADMLRQSFARPTIHVERADFLEYQDAKGFDRIVMNPPFDHGVDIKHILHAFEMLRPGGVLVALCATGPRQEDKLKPLSDSWEELPSGTFEGTGVGAIFLAMSKPELIPESWAIGREDGQTSLGEVTS